MWHIWKARNEKLFNNKDITPLDTLRLAMREAESWTIAQLVREMEDTVLNNVLEEGSAENQTPTPPRWRSQVDASWASDREDTGVGFVIMDEGMMIQYGVKRTHRTESPLHAEAERLIWALQETLKRGSMIMQFESDCQQLVNLIQIDEEEWLALATEPDEIKVLKSNFTTFSIAYLSRSLNICVDGLAKGARTRDLWLPYVNGCAPKWLASVAIQM